MLPNNNNQASVFEKPPVALPPTFRELGFRGHFLKIYCFHAPAREQFSFASPRFLGESSSNEQIFERSVSPWPDSLTLLDQIATKSPVWYAESAIARVAPGLSKGQMLTHFRTRGLARESLSTFGSPKNGKPKKVTIQELGK